MYSKIRYYKHVREYNKEVVFKEIEPPYAHPYYVFSRPPSEIAFGIGRAYDDLNILVTDEPLDFHKLKRLQCIPLWDADILDISKELFVAGLEIENNGKIYRVTKSTYQDNAVRVTEFDGEGPTGHIHVNNREWFVSDMMNKLAGGKVFSD